MAASAFIDLDEFLEQYPDCCKPQHQQLQTLPQLVNERTDNDSDSADEGDVVFPMQATAMLNSSSENGYQGARMRHRRLYSGADLQSLSADAAMGPIRQLGERALDVQVADVPPIS